MNPLGLVKKIKKKVKKTVKKVGESVGVDKTIKAAVKGGRKLYSATAPFNPALLGAGGFLQPGQLGIKNKENQALFDKSQQGTRIVGGALLGGAALSGMGAGAAGTAGTTGATGAGSVGGAGTFGTGLTSPYGYASGVLGSTGSGIGTAASAAGGGSFFSGLGGLGTAKGLLAGGSILAPMLMGNKMPVNTKPSGPMDMSAGNFSWGGSGGNMTAGQGLNYNQGSPGFDMNGNYSPGGSPESLQLAYLQQMMKTGGLTPEARMSRENRAKQNIRGAQADRGMFNSGLAVRQESEILPEIQAQMDQQDFSNLGQMYGMLDPMASRNFAGNQANLDRIYGLQRDRNQYLFGGAGREDEQDFLARMNYQNQQNQMWNNIGAAGMNYFLS